MKNIRNAAIVGSVALLSASPAFAQATGYAADVGTIVTDGKAMLTAIVPLVLAIVGFTLFKKLAHRAG